MSAANALERATTVLDHHIVWLHITKRASDITPDVGLTTWPKEPDEIGHSTQLGRADDHLEDPDRVVDHYTTGVRWPEYLGRPG